MTDTTRERIAPIIFDTYGRSDFVAAMVDDLASKIDAWEPGDPDFDFSREHQIMLWCWNWMAGGTTAESVARRIEAVLS